MTLHKSCPIVPRPNDVDPTFDKQSDGKRISDLLLVAEKLN